MMSNHSEDDSLPRLMKRIVSLTKDVKRWNEAWYDQRDATGKACWDQYYYGVASARRGNIYEPVTAAHKQLVNTPDVHKEKILSMIKACQKIITDAEQAGDHIENYISHCYILAGLEQALKVFE